MAILTIKPTYNATANWYSLLNIADGDTETFGYTSVKKTTYTERTLYVYFDTSVIPQGSTVTNALLVVYVASNELSRVTVWVDLNGDSSARVINKPISTGIVQCIANITNSLDTLSSILFTGYTESNNVALLQIHEVYLTVEYTESVDTNVKNVYLGSNVINGISLGSSNVTGTYVGSSPVFTNLN